LSRELDLQPGSEDAQHARDCVWNLRLGGSLPLSAGVRFGAGVFTDRSWEPEPRQAWIDQVHYYGAATGVTFETPLTLADREHDPLIFTSTFALRYAVGLGHTPRAVADENGIRTDPSLTEIDLTFHEVSLHVGSALHF
jgi:hypothetical protein